MIPIHIFLNGITTSVSPIASSLSFLDQVFKRVQNSNQKTASPSQNNVSSIIGKEENLRRFSKSRWKPPLR